METVNQVRSLLGQVLNLGDRAQVLTTDTPLLGGIPELDSLAVATVVAGLEDEFEIMIEDDEINGETFRTLGSLAEYVENKLAN